DNPALKLTIRWSPGHEKIPGNEHADQEAKLAAEGKVSPNDQLPQVLCQGPLPHSVSAIKQAYRAQTKRTWQIEWARSPRYAKTAAIDAKLPSASYLDLTESLTRPQASLIMQL
ncbi:hypothetical protein GLOTRDRAFT_24029, partial [Gloeophyllum trabeum ATCC 11539]